MLIKPLGHACLYLQVGGTHLYTDPWLEGSMLGACRRFPDLGELSFNLPNPDFIFISHHHWDHVILETLVRFARDVPVLFPDNPQLKTIFKKLGFEDLRVLKPWEEVCFAGGRLIATPSHVPFGEIGCYVEDDESAIWNLADTVFNSTDIDEINRISKGKLKICFAPYQSYDEMSALMRRNTRLSELVMQKNAELIANLRVDLVVPFADGLYYPHSPYMNHKSFINNPFEFIDRLHQNNPHQKASISLPFDEFTLSPGKTKIERSIPLEIEDLIEIYEEFRSFDSGYPLKPEPREIPSLQEPRKQAIFGYFSFGYLERFSKESLKILETLKMTWGLVLSQMDTVIAVDFVNKTVESGASALLENCNARLEISAPLLADLVESKNLLSILMQSDQIILDGETEALAYKSLDALWYGGFEDKDRLEAYLDFKLQELENERE